MARSIKGRAALLLGWKTDEHCDPAFLQESGHASPWEADDTHLVSVPSRAIAGNTFVVASSGSGKSYFVGRLLEEILLATRASIFILDPNADFLKFWETRSEADWSPIRYDPMTGLGHLPTEESTAEWDQFLGAGGFSFAAYTRRASPDLPPGFAGYNSLSIEWGDLDHSFFHDTFRSSTEVDEFAAAHEFAMTIVSALLSRTHATEIRNRVAFTAQLDLDEVGHLARATRNRLHRSLIRGTSDQKIREAADCACGLKERVTLECWKRYELRVARLLNDGVVRASSTHFLGTEEPARFQVVDISSAESDYRQAIAGSFLEQLLLRARSRWYSAQTGAPRDDQRTPVIVVVEEAHTFAPAYAEAREARACRDHLREIAAEGRKYGLALLLVSQRPDKVDPVVLGETSNVAVLGLRTSHAVEAMKSALAFESAEIAALDTVCGLKRSRALLLGEWTKHEPKWLYTAMRRSMEGGRDLIAEHWAVPPDCLQAGP